MSKKRRWSLVLLTMVLHPVLMYFMYPVLGTSVNAVVFISPVLATLFFSLRIGVALSLLSVVLTSLASGRFENISPVLELSRGLLSFGIIASICIGADKMRQFLHRRILAENALEERENRYRMVFENSAQGIFYLDKDGMVIDANPQIGAHLGVDAERLIGKRYDTIGVFTKEGVAAIEALITAENPPGSRDLALQIKDMDGNDMSIDLTMSYISNKGSTTRWIGMLKNTTERRFMAAQLEQGKRMAAIGRLAGGIAHDMNNILNAIMGSAFALRHELSNYNRKFADLDNITGACDRGAQLTQNLLGFARKHRFRKQAFSLNNVVESVLALLGRTTPKNIRFVTELEGELPLMEGDQGQTENAVMNLCINAIDAMKDTGRLTLSTRCRANNVTISVADTGPGIDDSIREQVFEPFFTTKPPGKGTGLGLSMVYGVVKRHHGKIALESSPGTGTTVTLTFPRTTGNFFHSETPVPPFDIEIGDVLYGRTVLLVDDEPLVLRAGIRMLQTLGCKVIAAETGKKAVELFDANRHAISLVVLDLVMPEMDGTKVLEKLADIDDDIPVMLASGYTPEADRIAEMRRRKANCRFVSKPYRAEDLIKTAKKLLICGEDTFRERLQQKVR